MRKVISHTILTLDGVAGIDAVADTIGPLRAAEDVESDFNGKLVDEDAMLLGRVTYEEWADFWPTSTIEPFASHINAVPKYVVSRSLQAAPWGSRSATLISGDLGESISELKKQPGKNIGVHGSLTLIEGLLHADLLDELRLEIYPVVAGGGRQLFSDQDAPKKLQLVDSKTAANGVVILTYEPLR